jgi:hypothetical protein
MIGAIGRIVIQNEENLTIMEMHEFAAEGNLIFAVNII